MNTNGQYGLDGEGTVHETVASYVLGILDDAEATAFEAHLAGCDVCAGHLEEFSGMEPMLAMLADTPEPFSPAVEPSETVRQIPRTPPETPSVAVQPSPQLLDRLVDEVAAKRARRRRRGMYLVAAAAVLIVGGPTVAVVATSDDTASPAVAEAEPHVHPTSPAEDAFFFHQLHKTSATDPTTKITATVGTESKSWGTHAVLQLKNVTGPLKCDMIAVSKTGERQVVTSWQVPPWGYGIPNSPHAEARNPLYVHGAAAMKPSDIDHFEIRTLDGKQLVRVNA